MYQTISINLSNLLLSLSDALDLASPDLSQHQLRTAFMAWEMGKVANLPDGLMESLFMQYRKTHFLTKEGSHAHCLYPSTERAAHENPEDIIPYGPDDLSM
jgi:hypothetical protein